MFCIQYFHVHETQVGLCVTDETLILADCLHNCDLLPLGTTNR
jgi:hypothetical protein